MTKNMTPGAMQLTRMIGARAFAIDLVKPKIAALVAA
jgi:hypothetical protein